MVGQGAVCFDIGHFGTRQSRQSHQGANLRCDHTGDLRRRHRNDPPAKTLAVVIPRMRPHRDPVLGSKAQRGKHGFRIRGVPTTGHIGRGDKPQHGRIIAHGPRAKPFAQIRIQVDAAHMPPSLSHATLARPKMQEWAVRRKF